MEVIFGTLSGRGLNTFLMPLQLMLELARQRPATLNGLDQASLIAHLGSMGRIMVGVPTIWLATALLAATATITVGQEPKATSLESEVRLQRAKCAEVCKEYVPGSKSCKVTIDMRSEERRGVKECRS